MFIEFQEIYIHIIILITTVLSFTNSLSRTSLYFSLKTSFVYSNLFSLAKTVTIRKTQYSCYENYFQVFLCFSKESYPEYIHISKDVNFVSIGINCFDYIIYLVAKLF